MNASTKRILSTIAIVIASVAFGILISADLGLMRTSKAQTTMQGPQGPVTAVTIRTCSGSRVEVSTACRVQR